MNIKRVQKSLNWVIIASETSHIFCCVLPTLFSLLTLASGIGLIAAVPAGFTVLHDALHHWEIPMIMFSAVLLVFGWGIHFISNKLDCHDTGCIHEPCSIKKKKSAIILKIATFMFVVNVSIYVLFHQGLGLFLS